jgi:hypothetical protein
MLAGVLTCSVTVPTAAWLKEVPSNSKNSKTVHTFIRYLRKDYRVVCVMLYELLFAAEPELPTFKLNIFA